MINSLLNTVNMLMYIITCKIYFVFKFGASRKLATQAEYLNIMYCFNGMVTYVLKICDMSIKYHVLLTKLTCRFDLYI